MTIADRLLELAKCNSHTRILSPSTKNLHIHIVTLTYFLGHVRNFYFRDFVNIYKTLYAYNIVPLQVNGPQNEIMYVTWNSDLDL